MGLITKEVEVKINPSNIKHYKNMGYDYVKMGDLITVKIEDLTKGSNVSVKCKCDYCDKDLEITYKAYNKAMSNIIHKVTCRKCQGKKTKEANMIRYGVEHPMKLDKVKEKQKESIREKYGVDYPMQSKEVRRKSKQSCLKKYGFENPMKNENVKNKSIETCKRKYGVENAFQSEEIKEKIKKSLLDKYGVDNPMRSQEIKEKAYSTNMEKYGVKHALQNEDIYQKMVSDNYIKYGVGYVTQLPEVRKKASETLYKNQTMCTSKQQEYIANLYNMVLNYPILYWSVDMYDESNNLCIEYDGGGHFLEIEIGKVSQEEFDNKELVREKMIRQEGCKIIRIISRKDNLPSDEILLQMLSDAKQYFSDYPEHSWINFDIDNGIVRNAEHKDGSPYFYGELRKIKKGDLKSA